MKAYVFPGQGSQFPGMGKDLFDNTEVAKQLFEERGIRGFFDGLTPKMLRAAVNHSVTFYVYDIMLRALT